MAGVLETAWNSGLRGQAESQYDAVADINTAIDPTAEMNKWDAIISGGVNPDFDEPKKIEFDAWVVMTPASAVNRIPDYPPE